MVIQLKVTDPKGEVKIIKVCETEEQLKKITVQQLKKVVTTELKIDEDVRLVYTNETMEESSLVTSYGIQHMSNLIVVLRMPGGF